MSKYTKQAEFEFKLRIYLKYLDFGKYFYQYINDLIEELQHNLLNNELQNKSLIDDIHILNTMKSQATSILNRNGYIGQNKIYTKEENIDDYINNILIQNISNEILDKLLEHLKFINDKYIILENLQN